MFDSEYDSKIYEKGKEALEYKNIKGHFNSTPDKLIENRTLFAFMSPSKEQYVIV